MRTSKGDQVREPSVLQGASERAPALPLMSVPLAMSARADGNLDIVSLPASLAPYI
jgi:hypothetical protein